MCGIAGFYQTSFDYTASYTLKLFFSLVSNQSSQQISLASYIQYYSLQLL